MANSFLTVGTRRVAVDTEGAAGPTVVLLHGIPGWRGTWRPVTDRLRSTHRTIAPDLLGFGDSDPVAPYVHASGQADMVAALFDVLDLDRVHLVGFDFGGPTAVLTARRARHRVASLTLLATNLFPNTPIPKPLQLARVPLVGDLAFRVAFSRTGLMALWLAAVVDRRAFPFERYRLMLRSPAGITSTRRIFLDSLRNLKGLYGEIERAASALSMPALVLWGDRDPFFPIAIGERTAGALRARFACLAGCGHFVPEERSADVAAAIAALVAEVEQASRDGGRSMIAPAHADVLRRTCGRV